MFLNQDCDYHLIQEIWIFQIFKCFKMRQRCSLGLILEGSRIRGVTTDYEGTTSQSWWLNNWSLERWDGWNLPEARTPPSLAKDSIRDNTSPCPHRRPLCLWIIDKQTANRGVHVIRCSLRHPATTLFPPPALAGGADTITRSPALCHGRNTRVAVRKIQQVEGLREGRVGAGGGEAVIGLHLKV